MIDPEPLFDTLSTTCVHFNGMQNDKCKAGIAYNTFWPGKLPCLGIGPDTQVCNSCRFPTPDEVQTEITELTTRYSKIQSAFDAVSVSAQSMGYRKGSGGQGSIECPICKGELRYSVAGCNGHIHAKCMTTGCVYWMQ